jgi:hypothetical protein
MTLEKDSQTGFFGDTKPPSVVYVVNRILWAQLREFFDEDGRAIPEARDDFVLGYLSRMTALVLDRRARAGYSLGRGQSLDSVVLLVIEDLYAEIERPVILSRWESLALESSAQALAGERCARRDFDRIALDEVPGGLQSHIFRALIEGVSSDA